MALLHDAIEDAPGGGPDGVREEIQRRFGSTVLTIVEACFDTRVQPKPPWKARKADYLVHLPHVDGSVLLVSAVDKLHNARSILTDLREHGDRLWDRFNADREETLWYYRSLVDAYGEAGAPGRLVRELARVVSDEELAVGS